MSVDFPRGFQISDATPTGQHDEKCSVHWGMLCDCHILMQHPEALDENVFYGKDGVPIERKT